MIGDTNETITVNQIYDKYRKDAKRRGKSFDLTRSDVEDIIYSNCVYCNAPPSNQQGKHSAKIKRTNGSRMGTAKYSGIDRMDNTVGYVHANCVPCCSICNKAKHNLAYEEWQQWLDRITTMRAQSATITSQMTVTNPVRMSRVVGAVMNRVSTWRLNSKGV